MPSEEKPSHGATTMRGRWGRLAKILAVNAVAIVVLSEMVACAVAKVRFDEDYSTIALTKAEFLQLVPRPVGVGELQKQIEQAGKVPLNLPREPHPFFGFSFQPDLNAPWESNNMGFMEEFDYPYRKSSDELVIGLFGGSVAQGLAAPRPTNVLRNTIGAACRDKGYRKVTVLTFAQGGWKQPQSAFCYLYYLDTVDIAIFLEGFNEIGHLPLKNGGWPKDYPWDFPAVTVFGPLASRVAVVGDVSRQVEMSKVRARQIRLTQRAAAGLQGRSMFVHLLWQTANERYERRVAQLDAGRSGQDRRHYQNLFPSDASLQFKQEEFFARYRSLLEMVDLVGRARATPAFLLSAAQPVF